MWYTDAMSHDAGKTPSEPEPGNQELAQRPQRRLWLVMAGLAGAGLIVVAGLVLALSPGKPLPAPAPTETSAPILSTAATPAAPTKPASTSTRPPAPTQPIATATQKSWILLPPIPATATQADRGAEIYRLVCGTCHGFAGEGLSYGPWVKTSAESCWHTRCHGGGHPQDGFALPHYIPPVIGPDTLAHFGNALALYRYTRATMPMHAPGTMLDEEYWEVTAFLVRANGFDPILTPLNAQRAAEVELK